MLKRTLTFFFLLSICFETATAAGDLQIISPKGGDRLQVGERIIIKWAREKAGKQVQLDAESLQDSKTVIIKKSTRNRGSFRWLIPKDLPAGRYTIKVTSGDGRSSAMSKMVIIDNPLIPMIANVIKGSCKGSPPVVYADERSLRLNYYEDGSLHVWLWAGAVPLAGKSIIQYGFDYDLDGIVDPIFGGSGERNPQFNFHMEQVPQTDPDSLGVPTYGCLKDQYSLPDTAYYFLYRMNVIAIDSDWCTTIKPIEIYGGHCTGVYMDGGSWSYPEILDTNDYL